MRQETERVEFTQEMKKDYTILVPNMLPVHFGFLLKVFEEYGYKLKILKNGRPGGGRRRAKVCT